jgi:hypothetical protein
MVHTLLQGTVQVLSLTTHFRRLRQIPLAGFQPVALSQSSHPYVAAVKRGWVHNLLEYQKGRPPGHLLGSI